MQSIENYGTELKAKELTANYVIRKYPKAMKMEVDGKVKFFDSSVIFKGCDGVDAIPAEGGPIALLKARAYVNLKRRANEEEPIRIHSVQEIKVALKHAGEYISAKTHKEAVATLVKIAEMQEDETN